jgi:hypothetical protein
MMKMGEFFIVTDIKAVYIFRGEYTKIYLQCSRIIKVVECSEEHNVSETGCFHPQMKGWKATKLPYGLSKKELTSITDAVCEVLCSLYY